MNPEIRHSIEDLRESVDAIHRSIDALEARLEVQVSGTSADSGPSLVRKVQQVRELSESGLISERDATAAEQEIVKRYIID